MATEKLNFKYDKAENYAKQIDGVWNADWVGDFDAHAFGLAFTQEQVDACMVHHLWQVKHVMSPQTYSLKERFALALRFLRGR